MADKLTFAWTGDYWLAMYVDPPLSDAQLSLEAKKALAERMHGEMGEHSWPTDETKLATDQTIVLGIVSMEQSPVVIASKGTASEQIKADIRDRLSDLHRWVVREKHFHTKFVTIQARKRWWQRREQTALWPAWMWEEARVSIVDFRTIVGTGKPPEFRPETLRRRGLPEVWIRGATENRGFVLFNHEQGGFWVLCPNAPGAVLQRVTPVLTVDEL